MPDRSVPRVSIHYYQAVATVLGILDLDGPYPSLAVADSRFPVVMTRKARKRHKPWLVQHFFVYPTIKREQPALRVHNIVDRPIHPMFIKGCWEIRDDKPCMVVYRNELLHENDRHLETIIPIVWEDSPPADEQFYELEAEVRDGGFFVITAQGPFDPPPPKATEFIPPPAPSKPEPTAKPVTPVVPLSVKEIRAMATPVKAQVVCKLNQVPTYRELPDKRIEFFLKDGDSDRMFTVHMKPKIFKKITEHGFADWVAAITSEIGPATETGFELVNATVQVFEKRAKTEGDVGAKDKAGEQPKNSATENAKTRSAKGVGATGEKKGLLDGVGLK